MHDFGKNVLEWIELFILNSTQAESWLKILYTLRRKKELGE